MESTLSQTIGAESPSVQNLGVEFLNVYKDSLRYGITDNVPDGFMSIKGWADATGKTKAVVTTMLKHMEKAGRIEEKSFRVLCPGKHDVVRLVKHYKVK